jgi:hypothetical protein
MEGLTDILVGLEERIDAHRSRLQELEKKRRRLDDEIATVRKYIELAETLYRVETNKAKLADLSRVTGPDGTKSPPPAPVADVTEQSREILLGRSKYAGKSIPDAACLALRESNRAMHAKELLQRLIDGGLQIKGKTPLISVATSLKRDRRFKKVAPNTFEAADDT